MARNRQFLRYILLVALAAGVAHADGVVNVATLGYSVYLPDHWVVEEVCDTQHYIYDTTGTRPALLSLVRHSYSTADYPQSRDWTRAHFIAYVLVVNSSPWSVVLYADSSSSNTQGTLWAPEAYCEMYSIDTMLDAWAEFSRFTATDDYGYELYAIGDTLDMRTNVGYYATILMSIIIPNSSKVVRSTPRTHAGPASGLNAGDISLYDVCGRRVAALARALRPVSAGIYVAARGGRVLHSR